jgi:hypothetical protein
MSQNICFYSNKCQWSKAFLTELAQTPWKKSFQFICVDPSPSRPALPKWLKKVPTLVVSGSSEPITDSDVMNWLYEKRMKEAPTEQQGAPSSGAEPMGFNTMEQVSFAKGFSYSGLDTDTSSQGSGGMSMPGTFSFLNGGASPGEKTGQEFPGGGGGGGGGNEAGRRKTKKEELFDKQMESYQRERESGMPKGPPRM